MTENVGTAIGSAFLVIITLGFSAFVLPSLFDTIRESAIDSTVSSFLTGLLMIVVVFIVLSIIAVAVDNDI